MKHTNYSIWVLETKWVKVSQILWQNIILPFFFLLRFDAERNIVDPSKTITANLIITLSTLLEDLLEASTTLFQHHETQQLT